MRTWKGGQPDDEWRVEIEHDLFDLEEQFVVSLGVDNYMDGERESSSLATPTPTQAREMADALRHYADEAERAEKQRQPEDTRGSDG